MGLRGARLVIGSRIDGRLDLGIAGTIERQGLLPESGIVGEQGDEIAAVIDKVLGVSCAGSCTQTGFVRTSFKTAHAGMRIGLSANANAGQ